MQPKPARHVLDVGVDVAGPHEVIGENLGERDLDRALRRPAVTARMVGRVFDRLRRHGCFLHPQRIEQLGAKDRVPVRRPRRPGDDPARQHMGDVGIGEGRAEARNRIDMTQRTDQARLVDAERNAERIICIGRQAGALGQEVEYAEFAASPRGP